MLNEIVQICSILEIDSKMTQKLESGRCGSSIFTKIIFEFFFSGKHSKNQHHQHTPATDFDVAICIVSQDIAVFSVSILILKTHKSLSL